MTIKVLLTEAMHEAGMAALANRYEIIVAPDKKPETLERLIGDVDALVIKLTRTQPELIEGRSRLKLLVKHAAGLDDVDIPRATRNGIMVVNTGDANAVSVAEHTLCAMGAVAKRLPLMDAATRRLDWDAKGDNASIELDGKVLGLVGLGHIGSLLARKAAAAFSMRVVAYDPYARPEMVEKSGVEMMSDLDALCTCADVVSLHTPLTDETCNLFDAARLARMRRGAILVNFARGGIVDEAALIDALSSGHIFGAALDVFFREPIVAGDAVLNGVNLLLSPHAGAYTDGSRRRLSLAVVDGIDTFFAGRRPQNAVNDVPNYRLGN